MANSRTKTGRRRGVHKSKLKARSKNMVIGRGLSFPFPERLYTRLRTVVSGAVTNSGAGIDGNCAEFIFKMTGVQNMGNALNYPLGTMTAPTIVNNPTGLYYLLSTNGLGGGGSVAPYGRVLVTGSSIKVEYSTEGTTNKAQEVMIRPIGYLNGFTAGSTIISNTFAEQPFSKAYVCPPVLNDKIYAFKHNISTKKIFGLTSLDTTDVDYTASASADPTVMACWVVRLKNLDNSTTTRTGSFKVTIMQDCIFYNTNIYTSASPI